MDERQLSEAEARALWERAARLQAEASARELAAPASSDEDGEAPERTGDYSVEVVRRAAAEAGIAPEFLDRALEEAALGAEPPGTVDRWADRFLGEGQPITRITEVLDAPVEEVFESLKRVLPNQPFGFSLAGTRGGAPLKGGTLIFEVPYYGTSGAMGSPSPAVMDIRHWADLKEVFIRLVALPEEEEGAGPRTEMHIWATTAHARRINFWVGGAFAGVAGLAAGLTGFFVTGGLLDLAATAEVLAQLGAGAASGAAGLLGVGRGWRPLYRFGQRKGREGMRRIAEAVRVDLHTGGAFTPNQPPQRARGDSLSGMLEDLGL